jgi:hypothetical protein
MEKKGANHPVRIVVGRQEAARPTHLLRFTA